MSIADVEKSFREARYARMFSCRECQAKPGQLCRRLGAFWFGLHGSRQLLGRLRLEEITQRLHPKLLIIDMSGPKAPSSHGQATVRLHWYEGAESLRDCEALGLHWTVEPYAFTELGWLGVLARVLTVWKHHQLCRPTKVADNSVALRGVDYPCERCKRKDGCFIDREGFVRCDRCGYPSA